MFIEELYDKFSVSTGINTDTRTIEFDQFFVALKGANFNGNQYADEALSKGAIFALVDEEKYATTEQHILVEDCLKTLQDLARFHRNMLGVPIVAITGSNGKTTTKELIQAVLSTTYNTFATKGNLNNHIGVPLSLLSMNSEHQVGIIEMGANHVGEIADLCKIAKPNFGIVTNIGAAHVEGFGSLENIQIAKNELYEYIRQNRKDGVFVNADDGLLMSLTEDIERITYGRSSEFFSGDIVENDLDPTMMITIDDSEQDFTIQTNLFGEYNLSNALCAGAVGRHFDVSMVDIAEAIEDYSPSNHRSQVMLKDGTTYILDSYNANLSSMKVAIEQFKKMPAERKIAILGSMLELGEMTTAAHQQIVHLCASHEIKGYFIGKEFEGIAPAEFYFTSVQDFKKTFESIQKRGAAILLKGSRGIQLEKLLSQ